MPRRILEGKVVSTKQDKTVTVLVERRYMHPIYKKYLKKSEKFAAHDEANSAVEGATIQIIECAPISKNKRFTVYTGQETSAPKAEPKKTEAKKTETKKPAAKKAPAKKPAAKKETKKL
jgi:small subunit ribosomal protein S17